jgi:hypothetical protein
MKHTEEVAFTTLPLDGAEPELEEKRNSKHTAEGSSNERFSTLTASTTFSPYTCISGMANLSCSSPVFRRSTARACSGTMRVHFRKRSAHAPPTAPSLVYFITWKQTNSNAKTNGRTNAQLTALRQDGWTDGRTQRCSIACLQPGLR